MLDSMRIVRGMKPGYPKTAPSPADERAAFEAWAIEKGNFSGSEFKPVLHKYADGSYYWGGVRDAWAGWQAHAASANETGAEGAKLNKPAKVGATRFGVGVKWSTVIGAAQRLYEYEVTPEKEAARIERARSVLDDIRNGKYASESAQADARIDVEAMLRACVPGGDICDPQRIADSIREWFDDHGAQADARDYAMGHRDGWNECLEAQASQADDRVGMTAMQRYDELQIDSDEKDPIERLRAFCSLALNGQDWLDVEPLFDALLATSQPEPRAEVTDAMIDAAIEALGPCVGSCGEASPPERCDIRDAIEAALAASAGGQ
ncbi:hypothetical protein SY91_01734 [Burkholderia cenocepacia]|nr:hypothetical protein SY91_01734 [Burkholderia cenocepacia]